VGGGAGEDSSVSNMAIGGGEGVGVTGGEGNGVGNGGGGGVGRVAPRKSLGDKPAAMISRSSSSPTMMCPGRVVSSVEDPCPLEEASSGKKRQKPEKIPIWSGYTPLRYSSTPSVENRTAAPSAEWTDEHREGWNPERTSGSLVGMRRIRAIPGGASKGAGPWRGPASGRLKLRSRERRPTKFDFRCASSMSGYTSGNSRTRSWSYCSDQDTPKPIRLSQNRTRSMCS
jgi:hypothetical protein